MLHMTDRSINMSEIMFVVYSNNQKHCSIRR